MIMKRTRQVQPAPASATGSAAPSPAQSSSHGHGTSGVIPLPKSHIRRTPSELQLADEVRRAEDDDVRMYARLVVGMQSQIQRDYYFNGGVVHPLSEKSLRGVVRTKQANDEELRRLDGGDCHDDEAAAEAGGWDLSFEEGRDECGGDRYPSSGSSSSWSTLTLRPPSKSGSDGSLSTRGSMRDHGGEEEEFVFSLEL